MIIEDIFGEKHDATLQNNITEPYLKYAYQVVENRYNPDYGDNRICKCGHTYYRHFDSYDHMAPIGCKYCGCEEFQEEIKLEESEVRKCITCGRYVERPNARVCNRCASEFKF